MKIITTLCLICCFATPAFSIDIVVLPPGLELDLRTYADNNDLLSRELHQFREFIKTHNPCLDSDSNCQMRRIEWMMATNHFLERFEDRGRLIADAKTESDARNVLAKWKSLNEEARLLRDLSGSLSVSGLIPL